MSEQNEGILKSSDEQDIETARWVYQVATSLWSSRANELWSQFNSLLTANSIVLATVTIVISNPQSPKVLRIGMPIVGMILCVLWLTLHARGSGYTVYWPLSAREIEEHFFDEPIRILSRGGLFSKGDTVNLVIDGKQIPVRMSLLDRLIKVEWVAYLVIIIFFAIYLALLLLG